MNTWIQQTTSHRQLHRSTIAKAVRAALAGIGVALLCGVAFQHALELDQSRNQEKNKSLLGEKALAVAAQLESELNADVFLANGLGALLVAAPDLSHTAINTALQMLHSTNPRLKNIALAPDNRISYIYPLVGNEKALGLYYPNMAEQWGKVQEAIHRKATVLAGPLGLRQGGNGLVSRTPVFMPNGKYWGMLSLVVDADALLKRIEDAASKQGLVIALRGKDGLGEKGAVFLGSPQLFSTSSATMLTIQVPGGSWQLAVLPSEKPSPLANRHQRLLYAAWGLSAIFGLLFFFYVQGRHRINASEKQLRAILSTTPDGVIVIDNDGTIEVFNVGAETMFGYSASEVLGQPVSLLMSGSDAKHHNEYLAQSTAAPAHSMAKDRLIHGRKKDGTMFPIEVKVGSVDVEGRRLNVGVLRDITERRRAEQKLFELATRDSLTGVANRRVLMDFLSESITLVARHQRPLSVLMIDADHFKSINDRFGHPIGDQVLIKLAQLASGCLRQTDKFGRMGGEEFLAVLPETEIAQAEVLADRMLKTIADVQLDVGSVAPIQFTISIGIASLNGHASSAEELLKRADMALYRAKEHGRNRYETG